jgi:hypothetical protein
VITQNTDLDLVRGLVHGRWKAQALAVAVRLGLPDALGAEARPVADLAAELGASPDGLGRLLRLLAALELVEAVEPDRFRANDASRLLRRDQPRSLRTEALHVLAPWSGIAWEQLESSIREGTSGFERSAGMPLFEYLERHPEEAAVFQAFQAVQVRRNIEQLVAAHSFPTSGTVVDVGGGNGTMLRQLLIRVPGLRGVLYDRPEAIAHAAEGAGGDALASRLDVVAGDFFESAPAGGDVYLLSHILHDWADAEAVRILSSVGAAMGADSELLLIENLPNRADMGIVFGYLDLLMLTSTGGRERTLDAHHALLDAAGLRLVSHELADQRTGLSVLTARRRATG